MRHALLALPLALLLAFASTASATEPYVDIEQRLTPEQRRATGLDTLSAEQLHLLNTLLRAQQQAAPRQDVPTAAAQPDAPVAESGGNYVGLDAGPISAHVRGSVAGWEPGTVFELDNGQQWKVLKGSATLPRTLQDPAVKIVPGVIGRWFIEIDPDMPKARVYRID